jgi:hypothetical protein
LWPMLGDSGRAREEGGRKKVARPRPQLGRQCRLDRAEREKVKEVFLLFYFLKSN